MLAQSINDEGKSDSKKRCGSARWKMCAVCASEIYIELINLGNLLRAQIVKLTGSLNDVIPMVYKHVGREQGRRAGTSKAVRKIRIGVLFAAAMMKG